MKNKLISIIIPVYNIRQYIEECVNSIAKQTYRNIEVLLIDDGSTDGSNEVCSKIANTDKRFHLYTKKNGGLSDARNYGIERAKGDYILFCDGDDLLQENAIELMMKATNSSSDKCLVISEKEIFRKSPKTDNKEITTNVYKPEEYIKKVLELNEFTYATGVLLPSKIISNNFFIKGRYFEDAASMYKAYSLVKNIVKVNNKLYKYRKNPGSIVNTINNKKIEHMLKSNMELIYFVKNNYGIKENKIMAFESNLFRSAYIMSGKKEYLDKAKTCAIKSDISNMSIKNKIKIFLLRRGMTVKPLIRNKDNKKCAKSI